MSETRLCAYKLWNSGSGVHQKKGLTFACTAVVGRASTRFVVTQLDDTGRVRYEAP